MILSVEDILAIRTILRVLDGFTFPANCTVEFTRTAGVVTVFVKQGSTVLLQMTFDQATLP